MASTSINRVSQGVLNLTSGISACLKFTALMVAAALVDIVSTLVLMAAVAALSALLLPVLRLTRRRAELNRAVSQNQSVRVAEMVSVAREMRAFDVTLGAQAAMEADVERVAAPSVSRTWAAWVR